jgi:8-oxo-dGTP pyrophosphatase MutT (NUDIX family)
MGQLFKIGERQLYADEVSRLVADHSRIVPYRLTCADLMPAAVLVPLVNIGGETHLLFTRRSETLGSHKGQVSFPGGMMEPEDESAEAAACREAYEEIGVLPEDVQVLGRLPLFPTISGFCITPVVGHIPWPYALILQTSEVSRAFTIPLVWLADPVHRELRMYPFPDGHEEPVIFFAQYDNEVLWGATARMTVYLLQLLGY